MLNAQIQNDFEHWAFCILHWAFETRCGVGFSQTGDAVISPDLFNQ